MMDEIYKVCKINPISEEIDQIWVFMGKDRPTPDSMKTIFSQSEISKIHPNTKIVYSTQEIHSDDSLRIVKKKMMIELGKETTAYDEIYLFSQTRKSVSIHDIFKYRSEATGTLDISEMQQLIINLQLNPHVLKPAAATATDHPTYGFADILKLDIPQPSEIFIPLGMRFTDHHDVLFPAYPYSIPPTSNTLYDPNPKNQLLLFDDSLLLNYGKLKYNTIYICMTEDVIEFANHRKISESSIIDIYYPLLAKHNIQSNKDLVESRRQRTQINRRILNQSIITLYDKIAMFHEIGRRTQVESNRQPQQIEYETRGIDKIWITIHPEVRHTIPLDVLFRNIHATQDIPMIKYNPGLRYDNLFRFYYEQVSPNLTKIPFLTKSEIMKLLDKIGSKKQLLTVVVMEMNTPVIVDLFPNGNMNIRIEFAKPIVLEIVNDLILQVYSTVRKIINDILQESGYSLMNINTIEHDCIEIVDIVYKTAAICKKLDFQKYSGCISAIFNVLNIDYQSGIEMRYKRVENYTEMEAENAYILEIYKKTNNETEIIDALKSNLGLTEQEARTKIIQFLTEHKHTKGAYVNRALDFVEHPGFHVMVHVEIISDTEYRHVFTIRNIDNLQYIHMLDVYIDSFIKINQDINHCGVDKSTIQRFCKTTTKKTQEKEKEERHTDAVEGNIRSELVEGVEGDELDKPLLDEDEMNMSDIREPDVEDDEYNDAILFDDYEGSDSEDDNISKQSSESKSKSKDSEMDGKNVEEVLKTSMLKSISSDKSSKSSSSNKEKENSVIYGDISESSGSSSSGSSSGSNSNILFDDYEESDSGSSSNKSKGGAETPSPPSPSPLSSLSENDNSNTQQNNIDGLLLNESNNNYFLKRLKTREPTLFISKPQGKFKTYSRLCPSQVQRQPVILNKREYARLKDYDEENYTQALKYNDNYYICPRYWCLKTNSTITQADVDAGKCGNVIPKNTDIVPKGAYVYEFNNADQHHSSIDTKIKVKENGKTVEKVVIKKGEYFKNNPGFLSPDSSADGKCLPCCFRKLWDSDFLKKQLDQCGIRDDPRIKPPSPDADAAAAPLTTTGEPSAVSLATKPIPIERAPSIEQSDKKDKYISAIERFPLPERRYGFLPISIQMFFGFHYKDAISTTNSAELKKDKPVLLRYGTEQTNQFSFISALCDVYAAIHKKPAIPKVKQMRQILAHAITLDQFTRLHNNSFPAVFKPKHKYVDIDFNNTEYTSSELYKSANLQNPLQEDYLHNTIAAYEEYKTFLTDPDTTAKIDHEYLWDLITTPNPKLFPRGVNLVILQIVDNDLTDNVELICPSSAYSNNLYDPRKETLILLKRETDAHSNYPIYEPIYLYEDRTAEPAAPHISRIFKPNTEVKNVERVLTIIQSAAKTKCTPISSAPRKIIPFRTNHNVLQIISILKKYDLPAPIQQVVNYQGKIIGLVLLHNATQKQSNFFLPTAPSTPVRQLPKIYMDEDAIWRDYGHTRDFLLEIHRATKGEIYSTPLAKMVEDGMIVGILTETNQFIRVDPPIENTLLDDTLETIEGEDTILADTVLTNRPIRSKVNNREFITKCILLETKMYSAFRSFVRILLNSIENRPFRDEIVQILAAPANAPANAPAMLYNEKLKQIIAKLVSLTSNKIKFILFDKQVILTTTDVFLSNTEDTLYLSKEHLISKYISEINKTPISDSEIQNRKIYFTRLADEFIRHPNIQQFMLSSKKYANVSNTEYKIHPDEFIILNSMLIGDYFDDIIYTKRSKHIHNTVYDNAKPFMIEQNYSHEVTAQEQQEYLRNAQQRQMAAAKDVSAESSESVNPIYKMTEECQQNPPGEIEGNKRSKWRVRFEHRFRDAKEWKFKNSINCTYSLILFIIYEHKNQTVTIQELKTGLIKAYKHYMTHHKDKLFHILEKQGKTQIVKNIRKNGIDTAIINEGYYLTDLDVWMLAEIYDLPIVLFSTKGVISMVSNAEYRELDWMVLDKNYKKKENFYFVKSDTTKIKIPRSSMIIPCMTFEDLGEEMGKFIKQTTLPNFHSLTQFLELFEMS